MGTEQADPTSKYGVNGGVLHWGVDSAEAAWNTYGGTTLYDHVVQTWGRYPSFWGRYLTNYVLQPGEAAWLRAKGCALLPVYNGAGPGDVSGTFYQGQSHGEAAVASARALGIPKGVALYLDIEQPWWPSAEFILGWSVANRNSEYWGAGGVYANPPNGNMVGPYNAAFADPRVRGAGAFFTCQPEPGNTVPPPQWAPALPDIVTASWPVVWQYRVDVEGVDLNQANEAAYRAMWLLQGDVSVKRTLALKPTPDHFSRSERTLLGGEKAFATGRQERSLFQTWTQVEVQVPNGPHATKTLVGWVLEKDLRR